MRWNLARTDLRGDSSRPSLIPLAALAVLFVVAGGALAHTDSEDHGTITFHDRAGGPPQSSATVFADPVETECRFWVQGYNVTHAEGAIEATSQAGVSVQTQIHVVGEWNATANGQGGYDFEAGPFTLEESGNWSVWASMDGHETRDHDVRHEVCSEEAPMPPACPRDVHVEAAPGEATLQWNASARAESFLVHRAQAGEQLQQVAEVNATTYVDADVEANATYDYRVTASNEAGESQDCKLVQVSLPSLTPPACPGELRLEATGALVALTWNASAEAEAYLVLRGQVGQLEEIARVEGTTFLDLDASAATRASALAYTVLAVNEAGKAQDCPVVETEDPPQGGAPACPQGLEAHAQESEEVRLTWQAADGAESYHVYRASGGSSFEHVAQTSATSYVDGETEAETTYEYRVTAANEAGESKGCSTVEVTAIPFFGSAFLVGLAALGSGGVVALARAR